MRSWMFVPTLLHAVMPLQEVAAKDDKVPGGGRRMTDRLDV